MKNRFIVLSVLLISACSRNEIDTWDQKQNNPFIGSWKINSIQAGNQSDPLALFIACLLQKDTSGADIMFTNDSLYFSGESSDRIPYQYNGKDKLIILKDPSGAIYPIRMINDSAIGLTLGKDTEIFLKRK
jgi:hypothetical protein